MRRQLKAFGLLAFSSGCLFLLTACQNLPTRPATPSSFRIRGLTLVDWTPTGYGKTTANLAIEAAASSVVEKDKADLGVLPVTKRSLFVFGEE